MADQAPTDTRAIELAIKALTRIEAHEQDCEARYQEQSTMAREMRDDMRSVARSFDRLGGDTKAALGRIHERLDDRAELGARFWLKACGVTAAALLAVIGWLLTNGLPWARP
jgi:predicted phage gp36 major capsid-like protein